MNSEDKFKELLNEKLAGKEFPFNAAGWEKAKELIDASRERKKRRAAALWLLLLCSLGVSTYLVWNLQGQEKALATATQPAGTTQADASVPATAPENATLHQRQAPAAAPAVAEKAEGGATAQAAASAEETAKKTSRPASEPASPAPEKIKTVEKRVQPARETPAPVAGTTRRANPANGVPAPVPVAINPTMPGKVPPTQKDQDIAAPGTPAAEQKTPATPAEKPAENTVEAPATKSLAAVAPEQALPEAVSTGTVAPGIVAASPIAARDSAGAVADATEVMIRKPAYLKHLFFIEAGANYLAGWPAPQKRDAAGFNPVAGIGYINNLTENLGLSLGIHYTSIGHLGAFSHTSKVNTLGLGEQSAVTVITPSKLHYLALPLRLTMAIDDKNSFGIGYTLAYLLTVDGKVETYDQATDYEHGGSIRTNYKTSSTRGYTQGFSAFDSQLSVLYRRKLYKQLFINTELQLGLTDLKDNKFFATNSFERTIGLKATLMYNIFKK